MNQRTLCQYCELHKNSKRLVPYWPFKFGVRISNNGVKILSVENKTKSRIQSAHWQKLLVLQLWSDMFVLFLRFNTASKSMEIEIKHPWVDTRDHVIPPARANSHNRYVLPSSAAAIVLIWSTVRLRVREMEIVLNIIRSSPYIRKYSTRSMIGTWH